MNEKLVKIRDGVASVREQVNSLTAQMSALLTEIDAKTEEIKALDTKAEQLRQIEAALIKAKSDLTAVQGQRESVTAALAQLRDKIAV